jgi:hypothetical protein
MNPAAMKAAGNFMPTGNTGNNAKTFVLIAIVVVVLIIVVVIFKKGMSIFDSFFDGIGSMLEAIGLKDDAEDIKADEAVKAVDEKVNAVVSPFNPTFYKNAPAGTPLFTQAKLAALADQIYNSVGVVYDDPEAALGAFKACSNWAKVSQLSEKFNNMYSKDVWSWLKLKYDRTSQKDILAKIANYAFALPKY